MTHAARPLPRAHRDEWVEQAFAALTAAGNRAGGARAAVVETLGAEGGCLSADEVHARMRGQRRKAGTASVYRALNVLAELGLLHPVSIAGGPTRYELVLPGGEHHHHLVCDSCGRTAAFEDSDLEAAIDRVSERVPYAIAAHDVVLRGRCPACA